MSNFFNIYLNTDWFKVERNLTDQLDILSQYLEGGSSDTIFSVSRNNYSAWPWKEGGKSGKDWICITKRDYCLLLIKGHICYEIMTNAIPIPCKHSLRTVKGNVGLSRKRWRRQQPRWINKSGWRMHYCGRRSRALCMSFKTGPN
jgi:hypothetical protein